MKVLNRTFSFKGGVEIRIEECNKPNNVVQGFFDSLDPVGKRRFTHKPNSDLEYQYFAINVEGGIIGYGSIYPKNDPRAVTIAVAIDVKYRGVGLGKAMWVAGEELAIKKGRKTLMAETDADNDAAVAIMRSLGWKLDGPKYVARKTLEQPE